MSGAGGTHHVSGALFSAADAAEVGGLSEAEVKQKRLEDTLLSFNFDDFDDGGFYGAAPVQKPEQAVPSAPTDMEVRTRSYPAASPHSTADRATGACPSCHAPSLRQL